ncbi:MAG: DUF177 domain-containing protein [Gemmatimonadota bacterium]
MLKVDLSALERKGAIPVEGEISEDDSLWKGTELRFRTPVRVKALVSTVATGEVVVRGTVETVLAQTCRRCLRELSCPFKEEVTLVYAATDELGDEDEAGEARPLPLEARDLDLGETLREELILGVPAYALCRPDCAGLCPRCGIDRNEEECDCTLEEPDPRWAALRTLKED